MTLSTVKAKVAVKAKKKKKNHQCTDCSRHLNLQFDTKQTDYKITIFHMLNMTTGCCLSNPQIYNSLLLV